MVCQTVLYASHALMVAVSVWTFLMSEKSESKRIGAKQHKNSGRGTHKGDASWENFTVDFKEVGKSFTLNKDVWAKATTDAVRNGNDPAIVVVIGEGGIKTRLAVIELSLLEMILDQLPPDSV
jgi:hypothetical protein